MKRIHYISVYFFVCTAILFTSCAESSPKINEENTRKPNSIEIQLVSVQSEPGSLDQFRLSFQGKNDTTKHFEMTVRKYEAQLLVVNFWKTKHATPLPLELFQNAIYKLGYTVKSVCINGINDSVYTAEILCSDNLKILPLDSRAVDAVTIAEKIECPIYIDSTLMN